MSGQRETTGDATKRSLREEMPLVTEFIDAMRSAFGADMVNRQIRRGLSGESTFYASENGIEIGLRAVDRRDVGGTFGVAR